MTKHCGGCAKRIHFWQKWHTQSLSFDKKVLRRPTRTPFHDKCWETFPEDAK